MNKVKINAILLLCLLLAACGTNSKNTSGGTSPDIEEVPEPLQIEVQLHTPDPEQSSLILQKFIEEKLTTNEYGGLYMNEKNEFVLQITKETSAERVVGELELFSVNELEEKSSHVMTVFIEHVTHSYEFLEKAQMDLHEQQKLFLTGERPIWSSSINVWTNQIDLMVSVKSDLDLAEMETYFGQLDFLNIREGSLAEMTDDDPAIPVSDPQESGYIKEFNTESNTILIDDQIYVSTDQAMIVDEHVELSFSDLKIDDYVNVWIDGAVLTSLPGRGVAVFVQRIEK